MIALSFASALIGRAGFDAGAAAVASRAAERRRIGFMR